MLNFNTEIQGAGSRSEATVNNIVCLSEAWLSQGRAMLRVVDNIAVTQSHSRSIEFTYLSRACASSN